MIETIQALIGDPLFWIVVGVTGSVAFAAAWILRAPVRTEKWQCLKCFTCVQFLREPPKHGYCPTCPNCGMIMFRLGGEPIELPRPEAENVLSGTRRRATIDWTKTDGDES